MLRTNLSKLIIMAPSFSILTVMSWGCHLFSKLIKCQSNNSINYNANSLFKILFSVANLLGNFSIAFTYETFIIIGLVIAVPLCSSKYFFSKILKSRYFPFTSTVASIQNRWFAHLCYRMTYFDKLVADSREMLHNFYLLIQTDID